MPASGRRQRCGSTSAARSPPRRSPTAASSPTPEHGLQTPDHVHTGYAVANGGCLMAELMDRITVDPEQCGGRPCIRGMRIRVTDVLALLAAGLAPEQILDEMPDLDQHDVRAALQFAARWLDHPILVA